MDEKPTISIIIPSLNEEGNIENAVIAVKNALDNKFRDNEILIFNDGSTDKTGIIADRLAKEDSHVKVIHNLRNMGMGYNFAEGVRVAQYEYIVLIPGDNEISGDSISKMFQQVGNADVVLLYTINTWIRTFKRRIISKAFTMLMNNLFSLKVRYYNGPCTIKASLLKSIHLCNDSFAYMACILVRLIKSGATFIEEEMLIQPRKYGGSNALSFKNFIKVFKDVLSLFIEIHFKTKINYNKYSRK